MSGRGFRTRALRLVVLIALIGLAVPAPAAPVQVAVGEPVIRWIDVANGDDAAAGTQEAPFKTLTYALSVSSSLDTLIVQPGTYGTASGETFPLNVYGQTLMSAKGADVTILQGDGANEIMIAEGLGDGDSVSGFTFTGGAGGPGSGLNCKLTVTAPEGWPSIVNNAFVGNASDAGGGALNLMSVMSEVCSPRIANNQFVGNSAAATFDGGAVQVLNKVSATFEGNFFEDNTASTGGAILAATQDATLTVTGNRFVDNTATSSGGAIQMSLSGGQVHLIEGNTFSGNSASDGGALWMYGVMAGVSGNDFEDSSSVGDGGNVWMQNCMVAAENNAISGCTASEGAAWYLSDASLNERNDTVVDMSSASATFAYGPGAQLDITNSIYWNPLTTGDIKNADSISYSCVYDPLVADVSRGNTVGVGVIDDDPMFMTAMEHDARLLLGSPCIDTADDSDAADDDYFGTARPQDGDGDGTADVDMGFFERPEPVLNALAGDTRYETAVEIARQTFPDMNGTVVIASGQNFPDALSAAGLAGAVGAPLLLTKTTTLPSEVVELMDDWGVAVAYVIGGEAAVSSDVFDAIADHAYHDTIRIAGDDRYETAALVALEIAESQGGDFSHHAFIARGDSFPDALSASPLAYASASPILLTKPGSLPASTGTALDELDIESAVVAGGLSAVSATTKTAIDAALADNGGTASERWYGDDRYATAVEIAENAVDGGWATWEAVGIATGENYPDALAGGARVGEMGGVVLLTRTNSLPAVTGAALEAHADDVLFVDVFGGLVAVTQTARNAVLDAVGW